ncbi:hypothetical protein KAM622c_58030 (plasmid) [Klebsiella quasipneumoniae subsp. quasipneumoniae]|nr:hypothetical protein KAM622c_58030 [Klebsiella quasipneumoniae subsp. quasipneumoniae]
MNANKENITKIHPIDGLLFLDIHLKTKIVILKCLLFFRNNERVFAIAMVENTPIAPANTIFANLSMLVEKSLMP